MNEKEQFEFCKILDDWYIDAKPQFKGIHPLGMRKEDLKDLVCKWIESKYFEDKESVKQAIIDQSNFDVSHYIALKNDYIQFLEKLTEIKSTVDENIIEGQIEKKIMLSKELTIIKNRIYGKLQELKNGKTN